jgi:hypothetical protein
MRYTIVLIILLSSCLFANVINNYYLNKNITRYRSKEINALYKSSHYYFQKNYLKKAINALENIGTHQSNNKIKNDIRLLKFFNTNKKLKCNNIKYLKKFFINPSNELKEICSDSIKNNDYSKFLFCAKINKKFSNKINKKYVDLLNNYYKTKNIHPFYSFNILSSLVNENDLTDDLTDDLELLKDRIKIKILEKSSFCSIKISYFKKVIEKLIYSIFANKSSKTHD